MGKRDLWYYGSINCFRKLFKELEHELLGMWKELGDERHITGHLIGLIMRPPFQAKMNKCISEKGASVVVTWKSDRQESSTGADIGAIINIDLPDRHEEKGILLQAKRFDEANGVFPKIKRKQAQQMMKHTAASFYIFYHPTGFWITSASNVHGSYPSGRESMALPWPRLQAIPVLGFSNFMINYFMKTFVGDARRFIVDGIRTGDLAKRSLEFIVRAPERHISERSR